MTIGVSDVLTGETAHRRTVEDSATSSTVAKLCERIESRDFTVGIMGLGYVGLPLALSAANIGFRVIGFDIDPVRVEEVNDGRSGINHISNTQIRTALNDKQLSATTDFSKIADLDAVLIAVPTPLDRYREPDLSFVENTAQTISDWLRPGQLVVLESTTWPGTTAELLMPLLENKGLRAGRDFFLAFSPEREDPGNDLFDSSSTPKVVGADDSYSLELACKLYDSITDRTVAVSSAATAEAVKLTENIFRSVNIALVNELKIIFDKMNIDIWEVIDAAKTKPFGFMPFYPGPGIGGHCIPVDPFYLTWKAREFDVNTRFIELAGQINALMPRYVVDQLLGALDQTLGRGLNGSRILLIGLAYKKNVEDMRESPALRLVRLLEERGAATDYHDPFIPKIPSLRAFPELIGRESVELTEATVSSYDAVLVITDHDAIDWDRIAAHANLIVDTRNVFKSKGLATKNLFTA